MPTSGTSHRQQQQQQQQARTRTASYFSARERLLNRDHDSNKARKLDHQARSVRGPRTSGAPDKQSPQLAKQRNRRALTATEMDHQEQSSESGGGGAVGRSVPTSSARHNLRDAISDGNKLAAPSKGRVEREELRKSNDGDDYDDDGRGGDNTDAQSADHELSELDASQLENMTPEQLEQSKQHVGPVMGIFFKVWSLVKVTKMRHNKMRRQNSEDTGQFHFISGDQLATTSGQASTATLAGGSPTTSSGNPGHAANFIHGKHILQDSHFRRAGSQPPMSSHISHSFSHHEFPGHRQAPDRLQVQSQVGAGVQAAQSVSTTNSSSSGVSSATSGSLANTKEHSDQFARMSHRPLSGSIGRNSSALQDNQDKMRSSQSKSSGRSWTSRIKNRSSQVNSRTSSPEKPNQQQHQQQSYSSRYRFRQADPDLRQITQAGRPSEQAEAPKNEMMRSLRSQSELQQMDELKKRSAVNSVAPPGPLLMSRIQQRRAHRMRSDDDDDATRTADEIGPDSDDEDSDLNDIYSTPNDSIQSVPSGQLLLEQRRASSTAASQPVHPMIKSFSSHNFSQILRTQQQQLAEQHSQTTAEPIDERAEQKISSSSSSSSKTTTNNNSSHQIDSIANVKQSLATCKDTRLSGSRFFISSSSSEDSQAPNSCPNPAPLGGQNASQLPAIVDQRQAQIPIHLSVHNHEQQIPLFSAPTRPDSLVLAPPTHAMTQQPQLFTPSAIFLSEPGALTHESTIAAMSPMMTPQLAFGQPQSTAMQQQQHQLLLRPVPLSIHSYNRLNPQAQGYKKSPSLFEMSRYQQQANTEHSKSRFSCKYPDQSSKFTNQRNFVESQIVGQKLQSQVPNSISLHDCKLSSSSRCETTEFASEAPDATNTGSQTSEYKLAQMLLKLGSNPASARDQDGMTALMHSILSENLSAFRCLIEHGVDLNETNNEGLCALDMISERVAGDNQLEMFNLLIDNHADFDRVRAADGTRLLDRLISSHVPESVDQNKLAYIDCLLHNGAKLGSSTWVAANGKHEIQLRLLRKLCQDGYFLYKKSSIEAAVYRFEYALRRIDELEQQLAAGCCRTMSSKKKQLEQDQTPIDRSTSVAVQQVRYQTYLGLSRCERKRKFYRRALEFAHMTILVDSISYEGYYSKAHILKDIGEFDDSLLAIDQTDRLVNKSVDHIKKDLMQLQNEEESFVFDGCFQVHDPGRSCYIEAKRAELIDNLEYLQEAKKHIARLRSETLEAKSDSLGRNAVDGSSVLNGRHQIPT